MPRYSYRCSKCDIVLERVHSWKTVLTDCSECGGKNTLTKEFYLTDIVKISKDKNLKVGVIVSNSELRSRGINDIKTYKINKQYFENKKLN